ncbi:MAG TPA: zf-HC2 domain-containing protein [Terracidiphilus sp.]|jgi:anti-sigma factor RsiW|nr:zf-HC2 domain-containing protein [Terracidiphilus sp.]
MNCELAHERVVLAAYGELPDEQAHELERHLVGCAECVAERRQLQALQTLAELHPVTEPPANLVARSRMRLEEALDALPPKRWLERFGERIVNNFARLQSAPVAAALLLVAGLGAGSLGGYEVAQGRAAHSAGQTNGQAAPASTIQPAASQSAAPVMPQTITPDSVTPDTVANISSIVQQPNSNVVEVSYNQVVPQRVQGSLEDPAIRQLLMMASEDAASTGIRDDSVGLLAAECRAGRSCNAAGIRDALMVALRYDRNAGVRQKALHGLEPYVAEDMRVRDSVLEALLNDSDPRIRTEAIGVLEPVEADTTVRQVLYTVANSDRSPQIRTVSRQLLSRAPQFQ